MLENEINYFKEFNDSSSAQLEYLDISQTGIKYCISVENLYGVNSIESKCAYLYVFYYLCQSSTNFKNPEHMKVESQRFIQYYHEIIEFNVTY